MRLHARACGGNILLRIHQPAVQLADAAVKGIGFVHFLTLNAGLVVDGNKFLPSHFHHIERFYVGKADDRLLHPIHDDGLVGNREERLARQPLLQRAIEH